MKYFCATAVFFIVTAFTVCAQNSSLNLSPEDSKKLIEKNRNNDKFVIIDVRTPEEFSQGRIENAVNIDFYSSDFAEKINQLDKNKIYLIYCRSGNRSGQALAIFKNAGIINYYNMTGGFSAWTAKKFPFVRE